MSNEDQDLLQEAYTRRVELELPNGKRLVAKPLDFETALEYLDLLDQAKESQDLQAIRKIGKEFPQAIEAGDQLKGLTMVELFDVVRFFITSRPTASSSSSSKGTRENAETSGSAISSPTTPPPTVDRRSGASPGPSSSSLPGSSDARAPEASTRL